MIKGTGLRIVVEIKFESLGSLKRGRCAVMQPSAHLDVL